MPANRSRPAPGDGTVIPRISAFAIHLLLRLLGLLPFRVAQAVGALLGRLNQVLSSRMAKVTRANLKRCFPQWPRAKLDVEVTASLIETGKVVAETGWIWSSSESRWQHVIRDVVGEELIQQAQQNNKGVLLLAPHYGNWELLNSYLGGRYRFSCLYDVPKTESLKSLLKIGRERSGSRMVEGNTAGIRSLFRALKRGEMIGLLPDQVPVHGAWVKARFYNSPALTMTLPGRLARKTNAVVVMGTARRLAKGRGFKIVFKQLQTVQNDDFPQRINDSIEQLIATDMSQYQWEYKRFKIPHKIIGARMSGSTEPKA